jgi:copper resistance protein C
MTEHCRSYAGECVYVGVDVHKETSTVTSCGTMRRSTMSILCIGVSCLSLLLCMSTSAWPHATLVKSVPARRAVLSKAPGHVQLWFNEHLEARFCHLSVWNAAGQQVDSGDTKVDPENPKKLSVGLPVLASGIYTVKYRVLSVDSHIVEDQFSFTIRRNP